MRVITLCTDRTIPLMQRTLPGWIACGLSPVVYGSQAACKAAEELGAESHPLECGVGGDIGRPDFLRFVEAKIDVWEHSLEIDDTLFLDLDVEVFADPRSDIPDDCDIFAQDDYGATKRFSPAICTGAFFLRRCPEVSMLLRDTRDTLKRQGSCDEMALNTALASSPVRVRFAPHDEWQTISRGRRADKTRLLHHNGPEYTTLEKKLASLSMTPDGSPSLSTLPGAEPSPNFVTAKERSA